MCRALLAALAVGLLTSCVCAPPQNAPMSVEGESVVLLHGLARTPRSMGALAGALTSAGYHVVNEGYPSRSAPVEDLAPLALERALEHCRDAEVVHVVTHSMGGILLRTYLEDHAIPQLGRVVMLGPPNQGSEVVDRLGSVPGFALINGPAGLQLGTTDDSVPPALGAFAAPVSLGVIAGTRTINPILSTLIDGPNDGKVSVESTKLDGMTEHLVLPVAHPFLMTNRTAIRHVVHFIEHGRFASAP